MIKNNILPIVFATDDNYAPFLSVCMRSIIDNGSKDNFYKFYVLITKLDDKNKEQLKIFEKENCTVEFVDVNERMNQITKKLVVRDYYTLAIFYRLFIPSLFPTYDKILYLDCDMVAVGDVKEMFDIELGDNIVGAVREEVMTEVDAFGRYSEDCLGVPRNDYFNSGLLMINCKEYKKQKVEQGFLDLLHKYTFEVAPDQDYLNILCKGKVKKFGIEWNKAPLKDVEFDENKLKIIHYKLWYKPWQYSDILYDKYFWEFAEKTTYYDQIKDMKKNYGYEKVVRDLMAYKNLVRLALSYADDGNNYFNKEVKLNYVVNG